MAGCSIIPVFQTFPGTSLMDTGYPGLSFIGKWVEVLGCCLISSFLILDVPTVLPMLERIWGSQVLGFLPVKASSGNRMLPDMDVTLYSVLVHNSMAFHL